MSEQEFLNKVKRIISKHPRGQTGFAEECGVSVSFVNDIVKGRRAISDKILDALGYYKRISIEQIKDSHEPTK